MGGETLGAEASDSFTTERIRGSLAFVFAIFLLSMLLHYGKDLLTNHGPGKGF
jgi:hypothetical protein